MSDEITLVERLATWGVVSAAFNAGFDEARVERPTGLDELAIGNEYQEIWIRIRDAVRSELGGRPKPSSKAEVWAIRVAIQKVGKEYGLEIDGGRIAEMLMRYSHE